MNEAEIRCEAQQVGSRTLEIFEGTDRLNRWIFDRFADSLGRRVLEIGAGIGNLTQFMTDRELVVATDVEDEYLGRLRARFGGQKHVEVRRLDLDFPDPEFERFGCDSAIAVNVLEHIKDDRAVLCWLRTLLGVGGTLCLYVPALQLLYGSMDRALGHHRRYEYAELVQKLEAAGFRCRSCRWMNVAAIPGWLLSGRILGRTMVSLSQVALYDRLVPLLRWEDHVRLPVGMNLTVIAEGV
jgi:SAM-dependent methyltransferase